MGVGVRLTLGKLNFIYVVWFGTIRPVSVVLRQSLDEASEAQKASEMAPLPGGLQPDPIIDCTLARDIPNPYMFRQSLNLEGRFFPTHLVGALSELLQHWFKGTCIEETHTFAGENHAWFRLDVPSSQSMETGPRANPIEFLHEQRSKTYIKFF